MKPDLITLVVSLIVFLLAVVSSPALLADPSAYTRYYIVSVIMISGVTLLIAVLRMLIAAKRHQPTPDASGSEKRAEQRRRAYRLTFAQPPLPLFVQTNVDALPTNAFSCPVKDISETGLALFNTGVYAAGQILHGTIIFPSGRTARVNGTVVREEPDRICLVLHSLIDPAVIMAEQRALIDLKKNTGPLPAVSRSALAAPESSLPSHCPKGIRRVK